MAFPFTTIADFEDGTFASTHFDVETDTNGGLDFPHYTDLARYPGLSMPYRGAYCMRVDMPTVSTAGAWLQETGSWDLTAGTDSINIRLKFWLSKDMAMSSDDVFSLIELWSATSTVEAVVAVKFTTAAGWEIGIGETAPTVLVPLTLGEWHDIEVFVDPAAGTGTIDAWLDGTALTQVASLTQADITSGIVGANPGAAFTPTAGTLLIDEIIGHVSTASVRIGSGGQRFPSQLLMIKSGHAFVGHGIIDNVSLLSGAAVDNVLQLWDTDAADTTNGTMKLELKNLTASETPVDPAGVPVEFTKGCYVSLAGTNPRAMLNIRRAMGYSSDGAIRVVASRRVGQPA
jgi:hypothetical protein